MVAVADTLVYDCVVSEAVSHRLLRSVTVPTLVLSSQSSGDDLAAMADAVADAMPDATRRSLAGHWHALPDDVLAAALREFFGG